MSCIDVKENPVVKVHYNSRESKIMAWTRYQWDIGVKLQIYDIPETSKVVQVHYANNLVDEAARVTAEKVDEHYEAIIPTPLFMVPETIYCYVYQANEGTGETVFEIDIPVKERSKPEGFEYTPEQIQGYEYLLEQLRKAQEEVEAQNKLTVEAAGKATDAAKKIDGMTVSAMKAEGNEPDATISEIDGVKHIEFAIPGGGGFGKDGATFIPNVAPVPEGHELFWTNDQELPNPEPFVITNGADGFSPVIGVTDIENGYRLTIEDKDKTSTVDVMNGTIGKDGLPGEKGFSPTVEVTPVTGGNKVVITDESGPNEFTVKNGSDGNPGAAGFSPTVEVNAVPDGNEVTITDEVGPKKFTVKNGTNGTNGTNGEDGLPGEDGFSPVVALSPIEGGTKLSITDKTGEKTAEILDGTQGATGESGVYQGPEEPTDPDVKVWIDTDGTTDKPDFSLGITTAQVGQIIKVKEIDLSGRPVLWEALDQETFYPIIEMTEPTAELAPNKFYKWGEAATLNITLGAEKPGVTNEFIFEFISGTEPTNLSVPGNVKWATPLKVEANKKYQVSILNGIGVIGGA